MRVHPVAVLWLHDGDQLVEDEELQLELGAVNKRLVCDLDVEMAGIHGDDKTDVEEDHDGIDNDELPDDGPRLAAFEGDGGFQAVAYLPYVKAGNNKLLHGEYYQLHPFKDVEPRDKTTKIHVPTQPKNNIGDLHNDEVGDNHNENPADFPLIGNDEMQPGV